MLTILYGSRCRIYSLTRLIIDSFKLLKNDVDTIQIILIQINIYDCQESV